MKKFRQLHLWIGLISSVFILIQAVTGLLLSEPWLIGAQPREEMKGVPMGGPANTVNRASIRENQVARNSMPAGNDVKPVSGPERNGSDLAGWIRSLHEGKWGGANMKIFVDITAVSLIILTVTGIVLSIRELRALRKKRKNRLKPSAVAVGD
jgi:hypothetical protein